MTPDPLQEFERPSPPPAGSPPNEAAAPLAGPSPQRPLLRRIAGSVLFFGWILWCYGQVRRDETWLTALCFYIPSPLLAAGLMGQAIWEWRARSRRLASFWCLLAGFPLLFTCYLENQWEPPPRSSLRGTSSPQQARLVHWNVWYARRGWPAVAAHLRNLQAQIYVLSEAPRELDLPAEARRFGPNFTGLRFEDMVIFANGTVAVHERLGIGRHGWGRIVEWQPPAEPQGNPAAVRLLAVDFPSHPRTHRAPLLAELRTLIEEHRPDLVVGDLNSPRRSPGLQNLPAGYRHAYEEAGAGWSYTWPVFCPVWAIDQCLLGPGFQAVHYELQSTVNSDHRLQVCDFEY